MRALSERHEVWASVYDWGSQNSPRYRILEENGAHVEFRTRGARVDNLLLRQLEKLGHKLGRNQGPYWRRLFTNARPDVIVVNDPGTYEFVTAANFYEELDGLDVPTLTISQYNTENGSIRQHLERARALFTKIKCNVFVSNRNLEVARRQLCLPLANSIVIDNPPAFNDWSILPFPATECLHLAIVARLECDLKGQDVLLSVLAEPKWRARNWKLTIAGEGPDAEFLRNAVNYYALADRVRFAGFSDDVRALWRHHALLVLCSLSEGKPLALTEAMVCGRPAVVTDVGGNAELIEDGVTGFVAESAAFKSFAAAFERAWEQKSRWPEMGMRAHVVMHDRLSPSPDQRLVDLILSLV